MSAIRRNKGFTLIEILIVVIILGILAAIVIPQFANASTSAKLSAIQSTAQSLRSQVALYKLQHNDVMPSAANFWTLMTTTTDVNGNAVAAGTANSYGPYMQSVPTNPLNNSSALIDSAGALYPGSATGSCGWAYDYSSGTGSGRVYGTNTDSKTLVGP